MKRQVVGVVAAVALAVGGTVALVAYVRSAKDDALASEEPTPVYVVTTEIAKGTSVLELGSKVTLTDVPQRLVVEGAVTDLTQLDQSWVASVPLLPGEQLLADRFVDASTLVRVDVPTGLQEITVALSPERAVGGVLTPGDTVGVLFSFEPFQVSAAGAPATDPAADPTATTATSTRSTPNTTHFTLHKVLVTSVQFSQRDTTRAAELENPDATETTIDATTAEAPAEQLLVTLAVSASEAEQVVFAAEFGSVWLTAEGDDATEDGTRILTLDGVYVTVPR